MPRRPQPGWYPPPSRAYAYLLGQYLGDGCVYVPARANPVLSVTADSQYPAIIDELVAAMRLVLPEQVNVRCWVDPNARRTSVAASYQHWPEVFPQHGPGRKHLRSIELEDWQQQIVDEHPEAFLRGLIHSDGCRTVNRFKTRLPSGRTAEYAYPRYFFSNLSADIRGLLCVSCDRLGIRWSQSNPRNISISHRDGVAALDAFVGSKR